MYQKMSKKSRRIWSYTTINSNSILPTGTAGNGVGAGVSALPAYVEPPKSSGMKIVNVSATNDVGSIDTEKTADDGALSENVENAGANVTIQLSGESGIFFLILTFLF